MGMGEYFTWTAFLFIIICGAVMTVLTSAGLYMMNTPPAYSFTQADTINLTMTSNADVQTDHTQTGSDESNLWSWTQILGNFVSVPDRFTELMKAFGVPPIVYIPFLSILAVIVGYELLQLKKLIWG